MGAIYRYISLVTFGDYTVDALTIGSVNKYVTGKTMKVISRKHIEEFLLVLLICSRGVVWCTLVELMRALSVHPCKPEFDPWLWFWVFR